MSTGGYLGAAAGGALGYLFAGPVGILYGASLGATVGMWIDPVQTASSINPDTSDLSISLCTEGTPIPDLYGTTSFSGNIIWYDGERTEEVKEEASTGKGGGSQEYTAGYKYYLSFAIALCKGPINELYCIYENDEVLFDPGPASHRIASSSYSGSSGSGLTIDDAENGEVVITVEDRGTIRFYFGTDDQISNEVMESYTGYSIPLKNMCYVVFEDFMIGENSNRVGALKFIIRKNSELNSDSAEITQLTFDHNPSYAILDILLNKLKIDSELIDLDEFDSVAQTLYNEGLGVSCPCNNEGTGLDYIESIFSHIRGCLRVTEDGKISPKLFRNDTNIGDMLNITDNDILEELELEKGNQATSDNEIEADYSRFVVDDE